MEQKKTIGAVVLAAGRGVRMQSKVQKQYLLLGGHMTRLEILLHIQEQMLKYVLHMLGLPWEKMVQPTKC